MFPEASSLKNKSLKVWVTAMAGSHSKNSKRDQRMWWAGGRSLCSPSVPSIGFSNN